MDGNGSQTSGNATPALLILAGAAVAILIATHRDWRERLKYDPVVEAQRVARKAIGIED